VTRGELRLAARWERFAAACIDTGLFATVAALAVLVVPMIESDAWNRAATVCVIIATVLLGSSNLWLLAANGSTIGKRALRIRITRADGSRATVWRLVLLRALPQWAIAVIPVVNLVVLADWLLIFGADRRCLHDYIADTIVVKA